MNYKQSEIFMLKNDKQQNDPQIYTLTVNVKHKHTENGWVIVNCPQLALAANIDNFRQG